MEMYSTYTANIASESIMFIVLSFLFISSFYQNKNFATTKTLTQLTFANMLLLLCQIAEWLIVRQGIAAGADKFMNIKRVAYGLDYFLYYTVALFFYKYINTYIVELYSEQGIVKDYPKKWTNFLFFFGVFIGTVFFILMYSDKFYYITASGRETFNATVYVIMFLFGAACSVSSTYTIIKNYDILKNKGGVLLIAYVAGPNILALYDVKRGMCLSYLLMSAFIFLLYMEIDIHRSKLLLEQSAKLTELKTDIMLSQIQPHFLYNTLTTISSLCYLGNSKQAKEVVDKLSDYLRENLESLGKNKIISFEEELEHIKTYLWIEQVRFGSSMKVEYDIGPSDFYLPSLTLQPLVENAVKHGIRKKKGGGTVAIKTREDRDNFIVYIHDDGAGFDVNNKIDDGKTHIGIQNITERLAILSGGSCNFESKEGEGTLVTVFIPKKEKIRK